MSMNIINYGVKEKENYSEEHCMYLHSFKIIQIAYTPGRPKTYAIEYPLCGWHD